MANRIKNEIDKAKIRTFSLEDSIFSDAVTLITEHYPQFTRNKKDGPLISGLIVNFSGYIRYLIISDLKRNSGHKLFAKYKKFEEENAKVS